MKSMREIQPQRWRDEAYAAKYEDAGLSCLLRVGSRHGIEYEDSCKSDISISFITGFVAINHIYIPHKDPSVRPSKGYYRQFIQLSISSMSELDFS
jgi:hypothetical protein